MVGTPNVWWVWSGGAPPTTWVTSDEDRYSERGARDTGGGLATPNVHVQYWVEVKLEMRTTQTTWLCVYMCTRTCACIVGDH